MNSGKIKFTLHLLILVLGSACGKKPLLPLIPEITLSKFQAAIRAEYVAGEKLPLEGIYAAGLRSVQPGSTVANASAQELLAYLEKMPDAEKRKGIYTALEAMLRALPVGENELIRPESQEWLKDPERDSGVGVVLIKRGPGRFQALDLLESSAAMRDNVRTGAFLAAIDGIKIQGMDLDEVVGRIRGPSGTPVELEFDYGKHRLIRGTYVFRNILNAGWTGTDGKRVLFLSLRSTLPGTEQQMQQLIQAEDNLSAIILDLRKLHLGDIEVCYKVADLFTSSGNTGALFSRQKGKQEFKATSNKIFSGPVYAIVGQAASPMAHVLAYSLQNSGAILLGPRMQARAFLGSEVPLQGGVQLRLTGGYALAADGSPLHEKDLPVQEIIPDTLPARSPLEQVDPSDPAQLRLAGLLGVPVP